jgi:hypothetical protein
MKIPESDLNVNAMEKLNTLPVNQLPEAEDPNSENTFTSVPLIETPSPPQVMDPSAPRDKESKQPPPPPGKRKRIPLKQYVKLTP